MTRYKTETGTGKSERFVSFVCFVGVAVAHVVVACYLQCESIRKAKHN